MAFVVIYRRGELWALLLIGGATRFLKAFAHAGTVGAMHEPEDHDNQPLHAKVLTVSDGVVHGTREDKSGAALEQRLTDAGWQVVQREVVADGVQNVADALEALAEGFHGMIVTTGGTGFGPRDATPEGTRQVLQREAPGLAEAMRLVNPLGRLSRGVAGTIGTALVLNTPGSAKGCVECLDAVIDVVGHAVRLLVDNADPHPNREHGHGSGH